MAWVQISNIYKYIFRLGGKLWLVHYNYFLSYTLYLQEHVSLSTLVLSIIGMIVVLGIIKIQQAWCG